MLLNLNALLAAFREQWEPDEASSLSYQQVEAFFADKLQECLVGIACEEEYIKRRRFLETLHTVPTEFDKILRDMELRSYQRAAEDLIESIGLVDSLQRQTENTTPGITRFLCTPPTFREG